MEAALSLVAGWAQALESSALGEAMRGGRSFYPAANVAHVFGLVLLVGGIGVLDLRIAGFGRGISVAALSALVTPLAVAGLIMLAGSGFLLFSADAGPLVRSPVFQAKMALAALGLLNAFVFRRAFRDLGKGRAPPLLARVSAVLSLCVWLAVGCLGRLIAYT